MVGEGLALGSSLTTGASDFMGGVLSRRVGALPFIARTQAVATVLAAGWVLVSGHIAPPIVTLTAGTGAGVALTIALAAFFQASVAGSLSIVAPISATGVAIPIVVGLVGGERPGAVQFAGIVAAVVGTILSACSPREPLRPKEPGVPLALLAAVGIGVFLWLMAPASRHDLPWAMLVTRLVPFLAVIIVLRVRPTGTDLVRDPKIVSQILIASLLAFVSIALYGLATRHAELGIVAVLASLFPAVTVLLAYRLLSERVRRVQRLGILAVVVGVALMAS